MSKALTEKIVADAKAKDKVEAKGNTGTKSNSVKTSQNSKNAGKSEAKTTPEMDAVHTDINEVTETKATRTGKFEIKKSKDGRYVFNLYASNNVIVATSQVYSSSSSAINGIKSVIANAASAQVEDQTVKNYTSIPFPKWEIYRDKGDQFRFRLSASNGSCVCHSQGYTSKTNCKKGIESIIKFANDAEITKAYINKDK